MLKHWIWSRSDYVKAWIHLLLKANWETKKALIGSKLETVKRGELITSIGKFAKETGMGERQVRTFWDLLEQDEMIVRKSTSNRTKITIRNYDRYQDVGQTSDTQVTNARQTSDTQMTTTKEDKNIKKDKKGEGTPPPKNCLFKNSGVTTEDIQKGFLASSEKGIHEADPKFYFEQIMDWSNSKGMKRQDWVAVARNWAIKDLRERKLKRKQTASEWEDPLEKLDRLQGRKS